MIDEELLHYGVPGMKWGVRRSRDAPSSSKPLSKEQMRETIERLRLEREYAVAISTPAQQRVAKYKVALEKAMVAGAVAATVLTVSKTGAMVASAVAQATGNPAVVAAVDLILKKGK